MLNRFVLLAFLPLVWAPASGANLIKNPGFDGSPATNGMPGGGWWLYEARGHAEAQVDRSVSRCAASLRLSGTNEPRFTAVSPRFEISPGDWLRYEVWARGTRLRVPACPGYVGVAFRDAEGKVFARSYEALPQVSLNWKRFTGVAEAPVEAVTAELHLGYTNATGPVWFDDTRVEITNAQSLTVLSPPKPWPGRQELAVRVVNREARGFAGELRLKAGKNSESVPVALGKLETRVISVPLTVPGPGAHRYQLRLLGTDGQVRRQLDGRIRTLPPLTLFPACPCFHPLGEGDGETRVDAKLAVNPAERAGLKFVIQLADASGGVLQTNETAARPDSDWVAAKLRVPLGSIGKFRIQAELRTSDGHKLAGDTTEVQVVESGGAHVTIGSDGFLRVAGQPHFPIGMYSCGQYETMGKAGFSGTHNYGITTGEAADAINPNEPHLKELLDRSWTNGMRMMVELPRKAIEQAQWAQIRRRIETFRDHPGLLCWGSEERVARGEAPLANLQALHELVRTLDPDHPLVLGDTRDVIGNLQKDRRNFFPDDCMDVGIWWWYPIPLQAPDANGLEGRTSDAGLLQPPSWLTTTLSKKPLWIAIQSYQQPRRDARFPTPQEYRCLAYLSIINGVKGLWFYTGSGQRDWQGKPAGLLNKPQEGRWDYVQRLVRELRELEPVITAKPLATVVEMQPADAPVEFALRENGGEIHLLAANKSPRAATVKFWSAAFAGRRFEVRFEQREPASQGGWLADQFEPFGVHVYRLR